MSNSPAKPIVDRPPELNVAALAALGLSPDAVGLVVVDHGSRRAESNDLLLQVAALFQQGTGLPIVEPAHMELAEPSIATAFERAVRRGARLVVVHPYFLAPGRHWREDIPRLVADAATRYPGVRYLVTAPLGLHPLMQQIMQDRVLQCLRHTLAEEEKCNVCAAETGCRLQPPTD